jgi:citrate lyase subunit beta/citryl-CoA lyase
MLFAPANRRDLAPKLARSGADAAILDLEDGVAPSGKDDARLAVSESLPTMAESNPDLPVFVRVNAASSQWFAEDLAVALDSGASGIVIPKIESPESVEQVQGAIDERGLTGVDVLAGVESAAGVHHVEAILAAGPSVCYFGAEDYVADIGGIRTRAGQEVLYARSRVALAAHINQVTALDQVVLEFHDDERFVEDAQFGRAIGYQGKICIHPSQVPLANRCFTPTDEQIERSRRLLDQHAAAAVQGLGVIEFDGQMVDEPLVRQARRVVAIADAIGASR